MLATSQESRQACKNLTRPTPDRVDRMSRVRTLPRRQHVKRTQAMQPLPPTRSGIDRFLRVHSGRIVALLCAYAALRILLFAAAFPIFNVVDEQAHLLSIRMYSEDNGPAGPARGRQESAKLFALYGTVEYLASKETMEHSYPAAPTYQLTNQELYQYVAPGISTG